MSHETPKQGQRVADKGKPFVPPAFEPSSGGCSGASHTADEGLLSPFVPLVRALTSCTPAKWREGVEDLFREARRRASDIERQAYREGFAQGERRGTELAQEKLTPLLEGLVRVMGELDGLRERIYRQAERELVELACAVAEKIVQNEVQANSGLILNGVQAALKGLAEREEVRIRVNPADLGFLRRYKGDLIETVDGLRRVSIDEDPSVARGGYIVETPEGNLDGRLGEQLSRVREELLARCPSVSEGSGSAN